jgi:hypothetical protein
MLINRGKTEVIIKMNVIIKKGVRFLLGKKIKIVGLENEIIIFGNV